MSEVFTATDKKTKFVYSRYNHSQAYNHTIIIIIRPLVSIGLAYCATATTL